MINQKMIINQMKFKKLTHLAKKSFQNLLLHQNRIVQFTLVGLENQTQSIIFEITRSDSYRREAWRFKVHMVMWIHTGQKSFLCSMDWSFCFWYVTSELLLVMIMDKSMQQRKLEWIPKNIIVEGKISTIILKPFAPFWNGSVWCICLYLFVWFGLSFALTILLLSSNNELKIIFSESHKTRIYKIIFKIMSVWVYGRGTEFLTPLMGGV